MSRVGLIFALAPTAGGVVWLLFQLFIAEEFSRYLVAGAIAVIAASSEGNCAARMCCESSAAPSSPLQSESDRIPAQPCGLTHRNKREDPKPTGLATRKHHPGCPSGKSFVFDCANDRREYGAASASSDRL